MASSLRADSVSRYPSLSLPSPTHSILSTSRSPTRSEISSSSFSSNTSDRSVSFSPLPKAESLRDQPRRCKIPIGIAARAGALLEARSERDLLHKAAPKKISEADLQRHQIEKYFDDDSPPAVQISLNVTTDSDKPTRPAPVKRNSYSKSKRKPTIKRKSFSAQGAPSAVTQLHLIRAIKQKEGSSSEESDSEVNEEDSPVDFSPLHLSASLNKDIVIGPRSISPVLTLTTTTPLATSPRKSSYFDETVSPGSISFEAAQTALEIDAKHEQVIKENEEMDEWSSEVDEAESDSDQSTAGYRRSGLSMTQKTVKPRGRSRVVRKR